VSSELTDITLFLKISLEYLLNDAFPLVEYENKPVFTGLLPCFSLLCNPEVKRIIRTG